MKKRFLKKTLSLLLVLVMLLGMMPTQAFASGDIEAAAEVSETTKGTQHSDVEISPLSRQITILPGQLDSNTDGEIIDSEIYGHVVNYELKKGHTLSISDENYVFSVRKLSGGNYSTMLKQADTATFTATEDMTVGCLIRKPDKSALTAEELSSIVLYDTLYGMKDVAGCAHRFTVEAETIDGGTATTRANIFLPETYSGDGEPTRLIVMTNGYSAYLTDSIWNGNTVDNVGIIRNYLDAGYAVWVVDNTAARTSQTPDLGCPQLVSSYLEAYKYIQNHFNVEEKFSIHSRSFGTFAAMRIMLEVPELVKCAVMTGPRVSLKLAYNAVDKSFVANRFSFADSTGATYEADKMVGHDPYTDVDGDSYELPPTFWMMASGDSTAEPLEVIEKLTAHGNNVTSKTYSGISHTGICTLNTDETFADALAYLEGHQEVEIVWEQGTIAAASGLNTANTTRLRTVDQLRLSDFAGVSVNVGYQLTWLAYDADQNYIGNGTTNFTGKWKSSGASVTTQEIQNTYSNAEYFRLALKSVSGSTMTLDDVAASGVTFYAPGEEIPKPESGIEYENAGSIGSWQDGAVYDGKLFVLGGSGSGAVYDLATLTKLSSLTLDNKAMLTPHANSVCFGSSFYAEGDKYPLLYVNVYNNYASAQDRMEGTCCVYRISETDGSFSTQLVQVIRIGFTEDLTLWKSKENNGDVRPYGNFVVDTDSGKFYAFVMRDADKTTRFFRFELPALTEGSYDETYGCNIVTLESTDIEQWFDVEYFNYLQGCCYYGGSIISVEGFSSGGSAEPALRVIDPVNEKVVETFYPAAVGLTSEPEVVCVDPADATLYYAAADGVLRKLTLDDVHFHAYKTEVTLPTCTEQGYTTYTCDCGDSYVDDHVDATGHSFGEWVTTTEPTCNQQGEEARVCPCGEIEYRETPAAWHNYENGVCTACGTERPNLTNYEGKTVSILGDSISTMGGVSNNANYNSTIGSNAVYYSNGSSMTQADTWWQQTIDVLDMELLVNNSWSGSCILHTRSNTVGAYIDRCVQLHNDHTGEKPDVIWVFMGTNDFSYYQSKLGTADIDYGALIVENSDGSFTYATPTTSCEAYAIMLHKMTRRYPNAEIYCMNLLTRRATDYTGDSITDVGSPTAFNAELAQVITHFGASIVDLENCGITSDEATFDTYIADKRVHPNKAGMDLMTEAVVSAMLGKTSKICTITNTLTGVINNNSSASALIGGNYTAELSAESSYSNMTVTVAMNGEDVTEDCYADGKITIPDVTGDIVISAAAQRVPLNFRWDFSDGELVSTGDSDNALTKLAGSTANSVFTDTRYQLNASMILKWDQPWVLEWKGEGTGGFMLSEGASASDAPFFFRRAGNYLNAFGEHDGSKYNNYGIALDTTEIDGSGNHVYRLENRIDDDGSNMIYLLVDGEEVGALNHYYVGGTPQNTTGNWISGTDFTINYIGTSSHPLTNYAMEYLAVWEAGQHTHSFDSAVTAPTCTEQGYTTYTCDCGDSYVADYVDATGHAYENGTCTICGAEHPNMANFEGKVISILGDSISTFAGYIPTADGFNLEHYARYPQDNLLTDVNETWWMQVLTALDAKLGINESWRSTEVYNYIDAEVNSSYDGTKACMASTTRIQNLGSNGTPDVILFFGGTNDITQRRAVGTFDSATAPTEVDLTSVKWDTVADAYVAAIMRMQHYYPDAEIVAMLPTFTYKNTDEVIEEYNAVFVAICEHYGVTYVDLRNCGITTADLPDGTHPDAEGMDYITDAVLNVLLNDCSVETGEHIVHSVAHLLSGAESSLGYYKGVSDGKSFVTAITGEDLNVTVTMGGVDITSSVYANGVVNIPAVTGDIVITAKGREKTIYEDHLQPLPEESCCGTNLWTVLEPENLYYTGSGWGINATGLAHSVTILINPGDQLWATSFQAGGTNGGTGNGIRITWFDEAGVLKSMSPSETYDEFSVNGYLTAPEGAVAVNVVMWNGSDDNELYIISRDHAYTSAITAPTCTAQGFTTHTCAACGDCYVDSYVDALGHSWQAATCTTAKTCAVCGETSGEALGHSYDSIVIAPTCTAQGYTTHTCAACGDCYVDSYVDALGHSWQAATCTTAKTCAVCGETSGEALGHNYDSIITAPTCTAQGYTTHTCAICGDSYVDSYVDALGHSWQEATCTTAKTCAVCGEISGEALGHSHESVVTAPTCTAQGYTTHTCAACGDSYVDSYVDALGHSWQEATCTTAKTCAVCGETSGEALGHSYDSIVIAPTCTAQGYTTHTCADCGDCYVDSYVDALWHTPGEAVRENEGADGSFDWVIYCTACGREVSRTHVEGHLPGDINGDGSVNNKDATRLFQYLAGWNVVVVESALDVNGDGSINNKDATRLFQYLAGWNVTIY